MKHFQKSTVFVSHCCYTKVLKFSDLKQYRLVLSGQKSKIGVLAGRVPSGASVKTLFPCLFQLQGTVCIPWLVAPSPSL